MTPYLKETQRIEKLVGHFGTALTMLNPGGLVSVGGERLHALTEGLSVEPGASIEIVDVRGSRVVVRIGTPPEKTKNEVEQPANENASTLDFEFPVN